MEFTINSIYALKAVISYHVISHHIVSSLLVCIAADIFVLQFRVCLCISHLVFEVLDLAVGPWGGILVLLRLFG